MDVMHFQYLNSQVFVWLEFLDYPYVTLLDLIHGIKSYGDRLMKKHNFQLYTSTRRVLQILGWWMRIGVGCWLHVKMTHLTMDDG